MARPQASCDIRFHGFRNACKLCSGYGAETPRIGPVSGDLRKSRGTPGRFRMFRRRPAEQPGKPVDRSSGSPSESAAVRHTGKAGRHGGNGSAKERHPAPDCVSDPRRRRISGEDSGGFPAGIFVPLTLPGATPGTRGDVVFLPLWKIPPGICHRCGEPLLYSPAPCRVSLLPHPVGLGTMSRPGRAFASGIPAFSVSRGKFPPGRNRGPAPVVLSVKPRSAERGAIRRSGLPEISDSRGTLSAGEGKRTGQSR